MSKKVMKITTAILTFAIIISLSLSVFATDAEKDFTPDSLTGTTTGVENGVTEIKEVGNKLVGILRTVGIVISVVIMIVIGIKYMMGSASEKAEYKKTMIPYVVGAVLLFGASTLATVIYEFATGL